MFENDNLQALTDDSDQVRRCPVCSWEIEDGQCSHCSWRATVESPTDYEENVRFQTSLAMTFESMSDGEDISVDEIEENDDDRDFIDDRAVDSPVSESDTEFNITGSSYPAAGTEPFTFPSEDQWNDSGSDEELQWNDYGFPETIVRPPRAMPANTGSRGLQPNNSVPNTPPPAYSSPQVGTATTFVPVRPMENIHPARRQYNERQQREMGMFSATPYNSNPHHNAPEIVDLVSPPVMSGYASSVLRNPPRNMAAAAPPADVPSIERLQLQQQQIQEREQQRRQQEQELEDWHRRQQARIQQHERATANARNRRARRRHVVDDDDDEVVEVTPAPVQHSRRQRVVFDDEGDETGPGGPDQPEELTYGQGGYLEHDPNDRRPEVQRYRNQVQYHSQGEAYRPQQVTFDDDESDDSSDVVEYTSTRSGGVFGRLRRRRSR